MQSSYCYVPFQSSCNRVTAARCPKSHFKQPKIALNMSTANSDRFVKLNWAHNPFLD